MAVYKAMTWQQSSKRWFKKFRGTMYTISARQLGCEATEVASREAANAWWKRKEAELTGQPMTEQEQGALAFKAYMLLQDLEQADKETQRLILEKILGQLAVDRISHQPTAAADNASENLAPTSVDRSLRAHVDGWKKFLQGQVAFGKMSAGRYGSYGRDIEKFVSFFGPDRSIDGIDAKALAGFCTHLVGTIKEGIFSSGNCKQLMMTCRQFISYLAENEVIPPPSNLKSKLLSFAVEPRKVATFSKEEVRATLAACDKVSERTKLFVLLALNCGMHPQDMSDMTQQEVDLKAGSVTRRRSKSKPANGGNVPTVTYRLWPETLALLKKFRGRDPVLFLTTDEGKPLVKTYVDDNGKERHYTAVVNAYRVMQEHLTFKKPLKELRQTPATLIESAYGAALAAVFLADVPRTVIPQHPVDLSMSNLARATEYVRKQLLED